jgi:outer membrane receptor protein involved in Fe transport
VLTAAAGALYGPGATGGVVNVILKRDYQGAEMKISHGFTQHGGGQTRRLDAATGRTSSDGRSGLSARFSLANDRGLEVGQRIFGERALVVTGADFAAGKIVKAYIPVSAGVNVASLEGPLTLKPQYGGAALGSTYTTFSTSGFTAAEAMANAGKLDLELSPDAFGVKQSLTTETSRRALIVSARHEAGMVEGFLDYLFLDNRGRATAPAGYTVLGAISPASAYNPFEQTVYVSRSVPWDGSVHNRSVSQRADLGLIVRLPKGWMAEGDLSISRSQVRVTNAARGSSLYAKLATRGDTSVGPGLSPFASQDEFLAAYRAYQVTNDAFLKLGDTLNDVNLRASGPLLRLPGGPMTMTVSAEAARERASGGKSFAFDLASQAPRTVEGNPLRLTTRSIYAEWRAPLGSPDAPGPLRGLELQAALRGDAYRMIVPQTYVSLGDGALSVTRRAVSKHAVVAKTLGLRTFVVDGVMLRASYSEGHLPPRSDQAQSLIISTPSWPRTDPRRGGEQLGAAGPLQIIQNGSPSLDPERARTFSVGFVVEPQWLTGARLSVDYLRTEKSHEITAFAAGDVAYFLAREALYPSRVLRASLTDADRAKGFTVGAVTLLDTSALNSGRSIAETVDVSAEYRRPLWRGSASAYLRGNWQPSYRRIADPEKSWAETAGYSDGPLRVRASGGAQWSSDTLSVGINAQYFGRYKATASGFLSAPTNPAIAGQDGDRIPSQIYLGAFSRWSIDGGTQVQLVVRNLLDARPPLALAAPTGYSTYGDAQGRGFEISVTRRF